MNDKIQGLIQHFFTAAGGAVIVHGVAITGSDAEAVTGGVLTVVGVLWSLWNKYRASKVATAAPKA